MIYKSMLVQFLIRKIIFLLFIYSLYNVYIYIWNLYIYVHVKIPNITYSILAFNMLIKRDRKADLKRNGI